MKSISSTMMLLYSFFLCMMTIFCRKWTVKDLIPQIPAWNYLSDPEELISDKNLGAKVNENYLKVNKVYEKTDINFIVISDIADKYAYKPKEFLKELYQEMEVAESIDSKQQKTHHLLLLIITKRNELLIYPSSDNLKKLISDEQILKIQLEIKQVIESKNYAKAVMYTFERLQSVWKKYTINQQNKGHNKSNKSGSSGIMDLLYIIPSIGVFGGLVFLCCRNRKKKSMKDD